MSQKVSLNSLPIIELECGPVQELYRDPKGRMSLARLEVQPGASTKRHYHAETTEFYWVESTTGGPGILTIDDEEIVLDAGEGCEVPEGSNHQFRNSGTEALILFTTAVEAYDPADTHLT